MYKVKVHQNKRVQRQVGIRARVSGTAEMPRLAVFRSNKYTYAQLIDDMARKTLASADSETKALHADKPKKAGAFEVGKAIAKKAKELKISRVVFDRGGYRYHGRVAEVARGAREGGLEL